LLITTAANAAMQPCAGFSAGAVLFAGGSAGIPAAGVVQARRLIDASPIKVQASTSYGPIAAGAFLGSQLTNQQPTHMTRISPVFKGGVGPSPGREPV
jgi:hypothetical protein